MLTHSIHPFFRILMLIIFAIALQFASMFAILAIFLGMILLFVMSKVSFKSNMLMKFRFLFLVILIVYALDTPGVYIFNQYLFLNPTHEGLVDGVMQILRLILMLSALLLLTKMTNRNQLMSGFYLLFFPLSLLGVNTARITARLWLTIHYAEVLQPTESNNDDWVARINNRLRLVTHEVANQPEYVDVELNQFYASDYVMLIGFVVVLGSLICVLH